MDMDKWDWVMISAAAYVAVIALVRLMAARRDQVIRHLRSEIEKQQQAKAAAEQAERDAA